MLFALVVMAGVVLVVAVFNNRRRPSRSEGAGSGWDGGNTGNGSAWTFGGGSGGDSGGSGGDCGEDGGACDGVGEETSRRLSATHGWMKASFTQRGGCHRASARAFATIDLRESRSRASYRSRSTCHVGKGT